MHKSSLLQDVLRMPVDRTVTPKHSRPSSRATSPTHTEDSDDEVVGVFSIPGTPARSVPPSRPTSPTPRASKRPAPGPLLLPSKSSTDPLRRLTTNNICLRIFGLLDVKDLANCSRVCKKWSRSQTLNYLWFEHYRQEKLPDQASLALPTNSFAGKWTKRESKENWRVKYIKSINSRASSPTQYYLTPRSTTPSGYQTPRELKEEQWRLEAEAAKPGKLEMREMYKELGGRKMRGKTGKTAARDKGGWDAGEGLW